MTPVVSVVIPTYKHRDYIIETLASVFAQTFTDYEVVVVNDGSPDDTAEVLRPLREAGRIRYFEQPNQGQAAARNRGIREARGEFIALLDDDDYWPADKLEWQVAALARRPDAAFVAGCCRIVTDTGAISTAPARQPANDLEKRFLTGNWVVSPGQVLVRAENLRRVGPLNPAIWGADDWELYIRLCQTGPLVYDHRSALNYRIHAGNASKDYWRLYRNSRAVYDLHIAPLLGREGRAARRLAKVFLRSYAGRAEEVAVEALFAGNRSEARRNYVRSLRINPWMLARLSFVKGFIRSLAPRWLA